MKITESQLRKIVREEYVRVLLERSGRRVTESRVRFLAEGIENGTIDEDLAKIGKGFWGGLKKVAGAATEKFKAGKEEAEKEHEAQKSAKAQEASEIVKNSREVKEKIGQAYDKILSDVKSKFIKAGLNEDEANTAAAELVDGELKTKVNGKPAAASPASARPALAA